MATIFSIVASLHLRNDLHAFTIDSSDILFHSSSIAVLNEPIFEWEDLFVLLSRLIESVFLL